MLTEKIIFLTDLDNGDQNGQHNENDTLLSLSNVCERIQEGELYVLQPGNI